MINILKNIPVNINNGRLEDPIKQEVHVLYMYP